MPFYIQTSLRIGLWEAHGRRCAYCGNPLSYRELEIDHVIPQRLVSEPKALAQLIATLGLPTDFELNDRRNLLPAHHHCNGTKSGNLFQPQNMRFYLEVAARFAQRVASEEAKYALRSRGDRVLAALQLALESGALSRDQVAKLISPARSGEAFELLKTLEFSSRVVDGLLERADVASLMDEPLLPRVHGLDELRMGRNAQETRSVRTCREWAEARRAGLHALTTYDIKEEAFFKRAYSIIQAFSKASFAETSFVDVVQAGLDSLELLPVTLLPALSGDDARTLRKLEYNGKSVGDLVRDGEVNVDDASRNYLSLTYKYLGKAFWVTMRADLNDDGIEDMLVSTYKWATQGTFGFGDVIVLTRRDVSARFEVVDNVDLLP